MDCAKNANEDCDMPQAIDKPAGYVNSKECPASSDVDVMEYLGLKRPTKIDVKETSGEILGFDDR